MRRRRTGPELRTERLLLRRWVPSDLAPFAEMNADPRVAEYLPSPLTREESDAMAERIEAGFDERGFGFWAVEVPGVAPLVGFVGLSVPRFEAPFMPAVEIGWRLARASWGRGYATEGALAALAFGFDAVGLDEIVAFTTEANARSRRVMERIGMTHDSADDFDHPALPAESPLRPHVLYRVRPRQEEPMIQGVRYSHTNLIARDWRALAGFYESLFGCVVVPPERDYAGPRLEAGTGVTGARIAGVHLRLPGRGPDGPTLEIYSYSPPADGPIPAVDRPGFAHLAFEVASVADARDEVLAAGGGEVGEIVTLTTSIGTRITWCYVTDPEGNIVELQAWE